MTTQWHHFVRSKTQISKRLYWLKRPAGCEIRQPVNIIELEEILSEQAREEEDRGSESEDEGVVTNLGVSAKKNEDEKKASHKITSHKRQKLCRDANPTEEIKILLQEFITNHFPTVEPEVTT